MTLTPQQVPSVQRELCSLAKVSMECHGEKQGRATVASTGDLIEVSATLELYPSALEQVASQGSLYWVSQEMAAVAADAAEGVEVLTPGGAPFPHGFMSIPKGVLRLQGPQGGMEIDSLGWGTVETSSGAQAMVVLAWGEGYLEGEAYRGRLFWPFRTLIDSPWHLGPVIKELVKMDESAEAGDPQARGALEELKACAWLAAAWELMETPTVAEVKKMPVPAKVAKKRAKKGRVDPEVRIVTLRPMRNENVTHSPSGRKYHHRWLVRGHWRNQACGPKQSERKRTWVPSYTKGPDGAPLIGGDLVKVWKR